MFDYLTQHPDEVKLIGKAMIGVHGDEHSAIADAYDFADIQTLTDFGSGAGDLLATIRRTHPHLVGTLYDLSDVVAQAYASFTVAGVAHRCSAVGGNFFELVPAGGGAYLLSHVIHDSNEEMCLTILSNCLRVMGGNRRLFIIESVLPAGDAPHPGKILDLVMLTTPGGIERPGEQYNALLAKASFLLTRIIPIASAVGLVQAVAN